MSSTPPSTLGKYQIIREIARSNDIVYEGYDPLMTRRVAVKELNAPSGATPQQLEDRIQRFKREAQAAGRLNHPNIMTVYDVEEDNGRLFMAMEYLDGQTLRAEIDQHGKLTPERAVEVACKVLAGLQHAHAQGVVHRDIKPDNVQILSNGAIKITDFGIARLTFQPNLTMDGQVFGTPSYMSPEQVVGKDIDQRSDLFAVGVMLYEMVAGVKPFAGDSVVTITYAIMNREPDPLPDTVPWALQEAIRKSLEKTPHLRFNDANEMIDALEASLAAPAQPAYDPGAQYYNPPSAYGTPAAPPVQQPYNPYGAPIQQPYNPYGAPVPQPVPAPSYQYNPYTQMPYGGPGPTMAPPPGPAPVYYPPPPRQPLLKPETAQFIKKLTVSFLVFGTFFALILVAAYALLSTATRMQADSSSQTVNRSIQDIDPNLPVDEQISKVRAAKSQLTPGASSAEIDRKMASLYLRKAQDQLRDGQTAAAEESLRNAADLDEHNPDLLVAYGDFFAQQAAANGRGPSERADLYRQSSERYLAASLQEVRTEQKSLQQLASAKMAYYYALNAKESGDLQAMRDARGALESAAPFASSDVQLRGQIEALLSQLR